MNGNKGLLDDLAMLTGRSFGYTECLQLDMLPKKITNQAYMSRFSFSRKACWTVLVSLKLSENKSSWMTLDYCSIYRWLPWLTSDQFILLWDLRISPLFLSHKFFCFTLESVWPWNCCYHTQTYAWQMQKMEISPAPSIISSHAYLLEYALTVHLPDPEYLIYSPTYKHSLFC